MNKNKKQILKTKMHILNLLAEYENKVEFIISSDKILLGGNTIGRISAL